MLFDPLISEERRGQLGRILESLKARYWIVPSALVVQMSLNMFAIGGPMQLSFVGEADGVLFAGETYEVLTSRWILWLRREWTDLEVAPLLPSEARVLGAVRWNGVPSRSEESWDDVRHITDLGISGLYYFSGRLWKSCQVDLSFLEKGGEAVRVGGEVWHRVLVALQRQRVAMGR
jgi:hypothetical protein